MQNVVPVFVMVAMASIGGAIAQEERVPVPVTLKEAMETLPSHTLYEVQLAPADGPVEQQKQLAAMIGDAAEGQHFYGAIYSFRPAGGGTTEFKMRSGLHSRDAARNAALEDCEAARSSNDSDCALVGEIVPKGWSEETPQLSHVAVQALRETAAQLPGNVAVARSRQGNGFEILSGDDVREAALSACNERNRTAALPDDCEIVIDDLAIPQ